MVGAGRADCDLRGAAARAGPRAADELGGLDPVVHAASAGFVAPLFEETSEAHWDAALGATAKGASSPARRRRPTPGSRAA